VLGSLIMLYAARFSDISPRLWIVTAGAFASGACLLSKTSNAIGQPPTAPVDTAIVRYADAQHGFHCDDRPAVLNAEAAADAWSETLKWFEGHIAKL